ncbi:hypothetical protein DICVIV_09834 [Dictyocaulus viviparus]|uniref:ACB domain-containing protein n=1 Tax=Dictyocaulus viviparus TaxID=29172 RepID=A0A0D8XHN6_DICVI|nr:hypothetical protein DICVIV_09834 [Dictyocaulus viviparus]
MKLMSPHVSIGEATNTNRIHYITDVEKEFMEKKLEQARRQKIRWEKWKLEYEEAKQRAIEFKAYWERRHKDDKDLWRDKDFANAVDKMSRAGYKGEHGNFEVPEDDKIKLDALYMQVTVGDYDGNDSLRCADEWMKMKGKTKIDAQREFIKQTNRLITRYGWNPPEGWV